MENAESAVVWRGPMKHSLIRQFLRDVIGGRWIFSWWIRRRARAMNRCPSFSWWGSPPAPSWSHAARRGGGRRAPLDYLFAASLAVGGRRHREHERFRFARIVGKRPIRSNPAAGKARGPRNERAVPWPRALGPGGGAIRRRGQTLYGPDGSKARRRKPSAPSLPPSKAQCISRRKRSRSIIPDFVDESARREPEKNMSNSPLKPQSHQTYPNARHCSGDSGYDSRC